MVGDVRHLSPEAGAGMEMYLPIRQTRDWSRGRPGGAHDAAAGDARLDGAGALRPIQPNLATNDFRTLQQLVDKAVSPRRFLVLLLGGFALFALVLASLGIYGVISYSVSQRAQEIGIRMALGASAGGLQRRILRQTLGLAAIGMAIGRRRVVGAGARGERAAVRRHVDRPGDVRRNAGGADDGGGGGGISAGAPGDAKRSDGGAAGVVKLVTISTA